MRMGRVLSCPECGSKEFTEEGVCKRCGWREVVVPLPVPPEVRRLSFWGNTLVFEDQAGKQVGETELYPYFKEVEIRSPSKILVYELHRARGIGTVEMVAEFPGPIEASLRDRTLVLGAKEGQ